MASFQVLVCACVVFAFVLFCFCVERLHYIVVGMLAFCVVNQTLFFVAAHPHIYA